MNSRIMTRSNLISRNIRVNKISTPGLSSFDADTQAQQRHEEPDPHLGHDAETSELLLYHNEAEKGIAIAEPFR